METHSPHVPYRWVRHLITCISKYQAPGRAPSAREEGECVTEWEKEPRHHGVHAIPQTGCRNSNPLTYSMALQTQSVILQLPTLDCYSETEAEDPDEETGSRSASVSRVSLQSRS